MLLTRGKRTLRPITPIHAIEGVLPSILPCLESSCMLIECYMETLLCSIFIKLFEVDDLMLMFTCERLHGTGSAYRTASQSRVADSIATPKTSDHRMHLQHPPPRRRATTLHSPLPHQQHTPTHTRRHVLYNKASVGHGPSRYVFAPRHSTTTATRRLTTAQRDRPPPSSLSASPMPPSFPPRAQSLLRLSLRSPAWCLAHRVRHPQ
jgi:hypothetical protein